MSERNDYIKAISKVGRALGTTIERDKLLQMIVKSAVDTMKGKAACLFLATDEKKDEYAAVAQTGLSKSYVHCRAGPHGVGHEVAQEGRVHPLPGCREG